MYQPNLLLAKELSKSYIQKFELLFSLLKIPSERSNLKRRPPHPKYALLNALIYKNLRSIPTLSELTSEIKNYPQVAQVCGFASFPSIERFASFLKDTSNQFLAATRDNLVKELIALGQIKGRYISCDSCPIKMSKKFARKVGWFCPWNHPKFFGNRYGCTTNLRVDVDTSIRQNIDYGSQTFKKLYNLRGSTERIFSRLLSILMQRPSTRGLSATRSLCTIAHIAVLVIALAAVKTGHKDKIRFVKSFIPNL